MIDAPTISEVTEELTSDQIASLRRRAQVDLYFLAKAVLGYNQLHPQAHAALCSFIVNEPADRRIVLMSRGALKSTCCTIADSVRLSLADPNVRILIANENFEQAVAFVSEIKGHWEAENFLTALFPELVPERFAGTGADWSADSASVNRSRKAKESTYMAVGVGGSRVGMHYEWIKGDDLAGNVAKHSATAMQKVNNWTDDLPGMLETPSHTLDLYGTRKTLDDVYAYNMAKWSDRARVFLREPFDENGETIFPKLSTKSLRQIEAETPEVWAADYMNNPVGKGGIDWGTGYISYFTCDESLRRVTLLDPLSKLHVRYAFYELDIVITCDPNSGRAMAPDKAAIIVHGVTPKQDVLVLEAFSGRPSPEGLVTKLHELCVKWGPRVVGIEEAGQQNTLFYFRERCKTLENWYNAVPVKPGTRLTKEERIRKRLDPLLKQRRLYIQPQHSNLKRQISFHPQLGKHDFDEIDCLAQGPEHYRVGVSEAELNAEAEAATKLMQYRGPTGYGVSCVPAEPSDTDWENDDDKVFLLRR